ncbi:B3 domain-containing protein At3g06220-like [Primulina eburnea]|uniref:B3 domain-containing protein At3g06220-like n=1 Tax=Primulina eburnea TaxID=1245227 RepID=UPI003C6C705B
MCIVQDWREEKALKVYLNMVPKSHPNQDFHGNSFYKIIYPGDSTGGVILPREFIEHVEIKASSVATLLGPCGCKRRIKLNEESGDIALGDGWEAFYRQNALKNGDYLLFTHSGNLEFYVQVYDMATVKKTC